MFRNAHQSIWSILSLVIHVGNLVDIVCQLVKSDPIKFILTKSLPDFDGSNFHGCIWTFPDLKSMSSSLLHIG